jgi:hypothetical protein
VDFAPLLRYNRTVAWQAITITHVLTWSRWSLPPPWSAFTLIAYPLLNPDTQICPAHNSCALILSNNGQRLVSQWRAILQYHRNRPTILALDVPVRRGISLTASYAYQHLVDISHIDFDSESLSCWCIYSSWQLQILSYCDRGPSWSSSVPLSKFHCTGSVTPQCRLAHSLFITHTIWYCAVQLTDSIIKCTVKLSL